jgi:hypothetical protein
MPTVTDAKSKLMRLEMMQEDIVKADLDRLPAS